MNRRDFDIETKELVDDGVKKACYIVREYTRCEKNNALDICAVTKGEYEAALKILLAYSYTTSKNDTVVEQWKCDNDCNRNNGLWGFCPGEFQMSKDFSKKFCKYFSDPFNI